MPGAEMADDPRCPGRTATPPPPPCELLGTWRAQYYDVREGNALIEDMLTVDADGTFTQVLTPYPSETCAPNQVDWAGEYTIFNGTNARLSYISCRVDAAGCLRCGPTEDELITTTFRADCESFVYRPVNQDSTTPTRTYYVVDRGVLPPLVVSDRRLVQPLRQ
jgi:hypothetical protein